MNPKGSVNRANRAVYAKVLQMRADGKTTAQIKIATGVARSVIDRWIRDAPTMAPTSIRPNGISAHLRDMQE